MIDFETARKIAEAALPSDMSLTGSVASLSVGWAFAYQTRRFLETNDRGHRVIGIGPLIVDSRDGSVHKLGSALVESHLRLYEDRWADGPPTPGLNPSDGITLVDLRNGPTGVGPLKRPFEKKW
jgi:hypothetical protein